jgi:hypothetical protein
MGDKLTKKCLHCGKSKLMSEYGNTPFLDEGKELVCKVCKKQLLISKNALIDFLSLHQISFNENTYKAAFEYVKNRELKKLKLNNINELPNDFETKCMNAICNRYLSIINLQGDYKAFPLSEGEVNSKKIKTKKNSDFSKRKNNKKQYNNKWMGEYTEDELAYLESYLNDLKRDFKIVTRNHFDYAMKIAQASLYMNKCYQDLLNGVSGAEAKYKNARETFDTLSKSAQFAEDKRGANDVSLGCFGKIGERVEQNNYIYEHIPLKKDDIDNLLEDFKHILKSI